MRAQILLLLRRRGAPARGTSICPSDAARALAEEPADWRALMPRVRAVAYAMAARGELRITQRGAGVDPLSPVRGAIRLALPRSDQSGE